MGENSPIEWTDHSFNPWIGCSRVSSACDHCYAEAWERRFTGRNWGPHAPRRRTRSWSGPRRWNRQARDEGRRARVFSASLADIFDTHRSIDPEWRMAFWALVRETSWLDWLILTKRPQNAARLLPADWGEGYPNVALGVTAESQAEHDRRVPILKALPARLRFLSMEPLLGPVAMPDLSGIGWVIAGGETGPGCRPLPARWMRGIRDSCAAAQVPFFFKSWGGASPAVRRSAGRLLDGQLHSAIPEIFLS